VIGGSLVHMAKWWDRSCAPPADAAGGEAAAPCSGHGEELPEGLWRHCHKSDDLVPARESDLCLRLQYPLPPTPRAFSLA
jgi:hypothetical protein